MVSRVNCPYHQKQKIHYMYLLIRPKKDHLNPIALILQKKRPGDMKQYMSKMFEQQNSFVEKTMSIMEIIKNCKYFRKNWNQKLKMKRIKI